MIAQKALAYFTSDAVDSLDQGVLSARCVKDCARNRRFHTAMMVAVLVLVVVPAVVAYRRRERGTART